MAHNLEKALIDAVKLVGQGHMDVSYVLIDGAEHDLEFDVIVAMTTLNPGEFEKIQAEMTEGADDGDDNQSG